MRTPVVWTLGTVYTVAALAGTAVIVWAADNEDNSADPTHWLLGAVVMLAPLVLAGAWQLMAPRLPARVGDRRVWITIGLAVGVVLMVGAQEVVADASACGDDDCASIAVPLAIVLVLAAWSLPLGLVILRRAGYPAPLLSAGLVAVSITLAAALAAAVQSTTQEDNYADLRLVVILSGWLLPALAALLAIVPLRHPKDTGAQRAATRRTAAVLSLAVGCWFVAMPFAAGVDSDSLPILMVVMGSPGVALVVVGFVALAAASRATAR